MVEEQSILKLKVKKHKVASLQTGLYTDLKARQYFPFHTFNKIIVFHIAIKVSETEAWADHPQVKIPPKFVTD